ncbi:hypothetical protein [Shewanella sp.]|uniref:hypothetical protein n=1 Tax=Shewanella sp. TaxID=50422 RepID=UPI0040545B87
MKWFFLSISVIIIIGIAYLSPKNYVFASLMDGGDQFFNANTEVEVFKTQPDGLSSIGSVDIFTNKLQFQLPQDWQLAFSRSENNMSTSEFISTKSSLNMWSEMICVQGFKGLGRHASPKLKWLAHIKVIAKVN